MAAAGLRNGRESRGRDGGRRTREGGVVQHARSGGANIEPGSGSDSSGTGAGRCDGLCAEHALPWCGRRGALEVRLCMGEARAGGRSGEPPTGARHNGLYTDVECISGCFTLSPWILRAPTCGVSASGGASQMPERRARRFITGGLGEEMHESVNRFGTIITPCHRDYPNFTTKRHRTDRNRDTQTTERGHKHNEQATGKAEHSEDPGPCFQKERMR